MQERVVHTLRVNLAGFGSGKLKAQRLKLKKAPKYQTPKGGSEG